jgi:thioredoxin-like negative regulator of GroEL
MTRNRTRIRLSLCTLFLLILCGACQPAIQQAPVSAKQEQAPPPPSLSVEALDRRILYLSHLIETSDLSKDDRELAQDLLASYRGLKVAAESGSLKQNYAPMIQILLRNLEQMEERYFTASKGEGERFSSEGVRQFELKRKEITEAFSAGDDQTVIDGILDLEKTFGPESLTPDLSLLFALSLGKKGTFTTALSIGQEVSRQMESQPDLLQLRVQMIDWQLALGNEKEAKEIYERLRLKLGEREAVVRSLEQKFTPESAREVLPESTAPTEELTKTGTDREVRETVARADELVQKGDFERAKFILLQQRIRLEEGPQAELIDQALKNVEAAEQKAQQQGKTEVATKEPSSADSQKELQQQAEKQDTLKAALGLIRSEKYEEAILKLDDLRPSDPEVKELKNMAVDKIVNRERNKAAKLFLMARNTKDPAKKEELLNASYNTLKAVADKYPSSPLIPKLQEHINQVTKELLKLKKGES